MTFTKAAETDRVATREKLGRRGLITITLYGLVFSGLLMTALAAPRGEFVLVVGTPGQTQSQIFKMIDMAGGSFVSAGRFGWIAVAHSDAKDFPHRLRDAGALAVLNHAFAVGCLQKDT